MLLTIDEARRVVIASAGAVLPTPPVATTDAWRRCCGAATASRARALPTKPWLDPTGAC